MQRPDVTVAVVPRERFSESRRSFESIYANTNEPFSLVYIDGGSPPGIKRYLETQVHQRHFCLVRRDHYLSPNEARNLALRHVDTRYVVFLDNDVHLTPGGGNAATPLRQGWEPLVVDNNCTDNSPAVISTFHCNSDLPLRPLVERRQGKSFAINAGIIAPRGDVLAFTDDDALVDVSYLQAIERTTEHHDAIAFGGKVVAVWPSSPPAWLSDGGRFWHTNAGVVAYDLGDTVLELRPGIPPPPGANLICRRRAFERFGLFRQDLGPTAQNPFYAEDTEFVERLRRVGERHLYVPDVIVYHPVPKVRLQRRYAIRWNFQVGRSAARMEGRPPNAPTVLGVPRYLAPTLATAALRQIAALRRNTNAIARFNRTQHLIYLAGIIYEYLCLPSNFNPSVEVERVRLDVFAPDSMLRSTH